MTLHEAKQFPKHYFGEAVSNIPRAEELDKTMPRFRHTFIEFVKSLPKGAKVLDIGCGKGKFSAIMLAYRPDIELHAMDISDVSAILPKGIPFKIGSAERLQELYEEDSFDAVICFHVIEHLLYPLAFMEGATFLLKKGGSMYLETPNWSRAFYPFLPTFFWNDYTHIRIFTKRALEKLFFDYDFSISALKTVCSSAFISARDGGAIASTLSGKGKASASRVGIVSRVFNIIQKVVYRLFSLTVQDVLVAVVINRKGS